MQAQLIISSGEVVREQSWPDDCSEDEIKEPAAKELANYFDTSGARITPKPFLPKPVPYAVRVLSGVGVEIHRLTDLAKSLGKQAP